MSEGGREGGREEIGGGREREGGRGRVGVREGGWEWWVCEREKGRDRGRVSKGGDNIK